MGNEGNRLFQEILAQIDENYEENYKKELKAHYKALEFIYLKCYNKYLEEKQAKQSAKEEQEISDASKQDSTSQKTNEPESSFSFCGDSYEPVYDKMTQEQKTPKFQIQGHYTVVASDIHGNIEDFLKILLENDLIILENSYQLVDLKTLESYDTFTSFKNKVQNEDDEILSDAKCVILPKFELNKDIDVTFNYLGDLIDEGRFSIECFYMMMLLMEKAKSCDNFEINYIAGNHEIANIILESKDTKDQRLRQCTKYYCYKYDDEKYLARSSDSDQTILKKLHNFQMGCVAEHSKKLIENGQMKLAHVDGNKVFIHANPSLDSVLSFLNIGKTKDEIGEIINNTIYCKQAEFLKKNDEGKRQYYLEQLDELNKFFAEEVKKNNLCDFNFDNEFLIYIGCCEDDNGYGKASYPPTFLPNFVYFVGHDSNKYEYSDIIDYYTFTGSKLFCVDEHSSGHHKFAQITGNIVRQITIDLKKFSETTIESDKYIETATEINELSSLIKACSSVKLNDLQREHNTLQPQINSLDSEITEKYGNKQSEEAEDANAKMRSAQRVAEKDAATSLEAEGLLENFGNAYAEIPDDKRGCICAPNGSGCSAM